MTRKRTKRHRNVTSLTLDPHIVADLKKEMEYLGEANFSNFVEGILECFLRETCDGCPTYDTLPEHEKTEIEGKIGAGKWITKEEVTDESSTVRKGKHRRTG